MKKLTDKERVLREYPCSYVIKPRLYGRKEYRIISYTETSVEDVCIGLGDTEILAWKNAREQMVE